MKMKNAEVPRSLKLATATVGALVTIIGGAWALEQHWTPRSDFAELGKAFQQHQVEQQIDANQERIWKVQDRLDKKSDDESARKQLKELEYQKERLQFRLEQIQKEGN